MSVDPIPPHRDPWDNMAWGTALRPAGPFVPWQSSVVLDTLVAPIATTSRPAATTSPPAAAKGTCP
jgi:hypothetical protein